MRDKRKPKPEHIAIYFISWILLTTLFGSFCYLYDDYEIEQHPNGWGVNDLAYNLYSLPLDLFTKFPGIVAHLMTLTWLAI